jgi:hypothetical protein
MVHPVSVYKRGNSQHILPLSMRAAFDHRLTRTRNAQFLSQDIAQRDTSYVLMIFTPPTPTQPLRALHSTTSRALKLTSEGSAFHVTQMTLSCDAGPNGHCQVVKLTVTGCPLGYTLGGTFECEACLPGSFSEDRYAVRCDDCHAVSLRMCV